MQNINHNDFPQISFFQKWRNRLLFQISQYKAIDVLWDFMFFQVKFSLSLEWNCDWCFGFMGLGVGEINEYQNGLFIRWKI